MPRLGQQCGEGQAFVAGVGVGFSDDEQMHLLVEGARDEVMRRPGEQPLLRAQHREQRRVVAAGLTEFQDLDQKPPLFLPRKVDLAYWVKRKDE